MSLILTCKTAIASYISIMFQWNAHRFSGGRLALDVTNTIVCRGDPIRRADRFAQPENIEAFASAATAMRSAEVEGKTITAPTTETSVHALLHLRESIDDWLRPRIRGATESQTVLAVLFRACAAASEDAPRRPGTIPLGVATARSAMGFFDQHLVMRTRICPNCDWLFVDNSKNGSRLWCDMKVCGNRAKARAHYERKRRRVLTLEDGR